MTLVAVAGFLTWHLMRHDHGDVPDEVGLELRKRPFATVCLFLTLFILVTFFVGFSLAFHDQALRGSRDKSSEAERELTPSVGLYGVPLPGMERRSRESTRADPSGGESSIKVVESVAKPSVLGDCWRVRFAQGSTQVQLASDSDKPADIPDDVIDGLKPERSRRLWNSKQVENLVSTIARLTEHGTVHVVVVGHANDVPVDPVRSPYRSNLDLSHARSKHVMVEVMGQLREGGGQSWNRIEWILLPFSSEPYWIQADERDPLSVEIAVLSPPVESLFGDQGENSIGRKLTLLDYVYFAAYTITTTGYGDIVPVSAFAKVVCSFANLFEVFFMVVFFNVLLSFLNGRSLLPNQEIEEVGKGAEDG